jgi:FkbM family methyltransferase
MGILNFENYKVGGEEFFITRISPLLNDFVTLDVGANIGYYSDAVIHASPRAKIYAFEPHPKTFQKLKTQAEKYNFVAINKACSDMVGSLNLYDYMDEEVGSPLASLYEGVVNASKGVKKSWEVDVTKIDEFVNDYDITRIRLLKIDTEGNELKVLYGAKESITKQLIDIIQFEFNESNITSKVFFKDIYDVLSDYEFYRLLPYGLVHLGEYNPRYWEIFSYQNIVAVRKPFVSEVKKYLDVLS